MAAEAGPERRKRRATGSPRQRPVAALVLDPAADAGGFLQTVAGELLWCDRRLGAGAWPAERPTVAGSPGPLPLELFHDGPGLVGGRTETVRAWRSARGDRVVGFECGSRFGISADGCSVVRDAASPSSAGPERLLELAVGAPLALALALRGVHLLHAAALASGQAAVALCGASGAGKSTLAAAAAEHPGLGLRRVADDVLPVRLGREPLALPHYPQLKLPLDQGYPERAPARLRLAALVLLDRDGAGAGVTLERLEPAAALPEIVRAGVSTRLFDRDLLARHFELCAESASRLPVARLRYPDGGAHLAAALEALRSLSEGEFSVETGGPIW